MISRDMKSELLKLFEILLAEGFDNDYYRRIDIPSEAEIYLGVSSDKEPYFRFIAEKDKWRQIEEIQPRNGFQIVPDTLSTNEAATKKAYRIIKRKHIDNDIFFSFIANLIEAVYNSASVDSISNLIDRLMQWASFFKKYPSGILNQKQQIGLFGELYFLRMYLEKGNLNIIKNWKGPDKAAKDFVFNSFAVEIKTSVVSDNNVVHISNEYQLDSSGLAKLFLFNLLVAEDNVDGQTIPEIVDEIMEFTVADQKLHFKFRTLLNEIGYNEAFKEQYKLRIAPQVFYCYEVTPDFPRIIPSDLKQGIHNVSYNIELSHCLRYLYPYGEFESLVSGGVESE